MDRDRFAPTHLLSGAIRDAGGFREIIQRGPAIDDFFGGGINHAMMVRIVPAAVKTHCTQFAGKMRHMTMLFNERLKWAREKAGYSSPRVAANAFGWNENTYKSHENGIRGDDDRPPSADHVKKYASRFKVDFVWLYTGRGSPTRRSIAKVVGRIGAGAEIEPEFEQVPPEGLYEIESDVPLPPEMIGFEVIGDSMLPRYDQGDVVVCPSTGIAIDQLIDGEEVAVRTSDGRRFLKKIYRENGAFRLESHNARPIFNIHIEWAADIWTVVRSRKLRKLNGDMKRKQPAT